MDGGERGRSSLGAPDRRTGRPRGRSGWCHLPAAADALCTCAGTRCHFCTPVLLSRQPLQRHPLLTMGFTNGSRLSTPITLHRMFSVAWFQPREAVGRAASQVGRSLVDRLCWTGTGLPPAAPRSPWHPPQLSRHVADLAGPRECLPTTHPCGPLNGGARGGTLRLAQLEGPRAGVAHTIQCCVPIAALLGPQVTLTPTTIGLRGCTE